MDTADAIALTEYVRARGDSLLRFAFLLTGNHATAEDAVQTVLARAFLGWTRIKHYGNLDAYFRRALVNERTTQWRRNRKREVSLETLPELVCPDTLARSDDRLALMGVMSRLPRKQRAAIVLRYFEGLPDAEIAVILDCSTSTVRTLVARGLSKIRATVDVSADDTTQEHVLNGGLL